jgi:hypothetical protein
MRMATTEYASNVFINCPFDDDYTSILDTLIFTIFDCGFIPRCAMEIDDSAQIRIDKIFKIVEECKFAVHDISRTELDQHTQLPRFNMPLELGMFLGARRFGGPRHKEKSCLIMDSEQYRYQQFMSDISGQDIKAHNGQARIAVRLVRDWLNAASRRKTIPGGAMIWNRFEEYRDALPRICADAGLELGEMTFNDKAQFSSEWLRQGG